MLTLTQYIKRIQELHEKTNKMAEELQVIHRNMEGKGVSPAQAPLVIDKLKEIEAKLRMIGANLDNPVPF